MKDKKFTKKKQVGTLSRLKKLEKKLHELEKKKKGISLEDIEFPSWAK